MRTETLDDNFRASNPGGVDLHEGKLKHLQPELFSTWKWLLFHLRNLSFPVPRHFWKTHIKEHLKYGDSRAAVVVSTSPLLIAAYTDELDCVALLRFDSGLVAKYGLGVGSRLLSVNTYYDLEGSYEKDLTAGPETTESFGNFHPFIAEFLTVDLHRVEERKAEIDESEWGRAEAFGKKYINQPGAMARDGRPVVSMEAASLPLTDG